VTVAVDQYLAPWFRVFELMHQLDAVALEVQRQHVLEAEVQRFVVVALDREDWGNASELSQYGHRADIAAVEDEVCAGEVGDDAFVQEAVGIGDDADEHAASMPYGAVLLSPPR